MEQTNVKFNQTKDEMNQMKEILNKTKYAHTIMIGGLDDFNQLGEIPNKKYDNISVIHPSTKSSIDPYSLLSISNYCDHSVQVTKSGTLLGIGYNVKGDICDSLPKQRIKQFTEFSIKDSSGKQLDPVSAVCYFNGVLYMFSSGDKKQLVLCDEEINSGHPIFLDIGNEFPVSLFGGRSHSAAITNKGEIIFINRLAVKKSPESNITSISLPGGEKAIGVACCEDSVVALSSKGRVFASAVESECILKFSSVSELANQEIVWVSGVHDHFLVVSKEGRVFGRGSNLRGQLGLEQKIDKVTSFTQISSLNSHEIRAAYAGDWFSLFETRGGKILSCGQNRNCELLLSKDAHNNVFSPTETTITESASFCIAGCGSSIVFIGGDPPPNTPNRMIQKIE